MVVLLMVLWVVSMEGVMDGLNGRCDGWSQWKRSKGKGLTDRKKFMEVQKSPPPPGSDAL